MQSMPNEENLPSPENLNSPVVPPAPAEPTSRAKIIKNTIFIIFICVSYYSAWWIYTHGQELVDFVRYRTHTPTSEVVALADKTDMTQEGRYIFYVSDPKIDDKDAFNQHCGGISDEQHTVVLGCYRLQNIFVYNVTDPRLYGVKEVTAAHEMLHAVYERMPIEEKLVVNRLIQEELVKLQNPRLRETAELYSREDASVIWNEMHSILGTEHRPLSAELEAHYKKYFNDRGKVVALAEAYEGVFNASKQRLKALDDKLASMKKQIDINYAEIEARKNQLNQETARLDSLRAGDPATYNAAVPGYNALVHAYNGLVVTTRELVESYNAIVEQRNNEAASHNDLYESLDSQKVQTVPGT